MFVLLVLGTMLVPWTFAPKIAHLLGSPSELQSRREVLVNCRGTLLLCDLEEKAWIFIAANGIVHVESNDSGSPNMLCCHLSH